MKILWIVNTIFPEVAVEIGTEVTNAGGWMCALAEDIQLNEGIELAIASVYDGNELKKINVNGNRYYLIPLSGESRTKYNSDLEKYWKTINDDFKADVVHIHGTEYPHSLAFLNGVKKQENVVVSLQGLISVCERYYYAGIDFADIVRNITFRDIVRVDSIINQRKHFKERGSFEKSILSRVPNIIGRTNWDYIHAKALNPNSEYFLCNESLRTSFYNLKWDIKNINRNSILLSQASYPLKGLHILLKACSSLKEQYEDLTIKIGGDNIMKNCNFKDKIKRSGYAKYIGRLVKEYGLEKNIVWLGQLNEDEMAKEMVKANVFICPSSIENSSNSLGEAQLIGTPCVASYVGGIPDMITHGHDGLLYRFEEYEMLASSISSIFEDNELAIKLSKNGRITSQKRHNRIDNLKELLGIYEEIINN